MTSRRSEAAAARPTRTNWEIRLEWERLLGRDRWVGLSWPEEYGGRAASIVEQVIFHEEFAKANAPARVSLFGEGLFAPTLIAVRHREAEAALPAEDPVGRGAVVPGLLRAQRGLGPLERADARGARRRPVGRQRPEGVDDARAPRPVVLRRRAHESRRAGAQGPVVPADPDGPARRHGPADEADDGHRRVQRGLLRRRAHRPVDLVVGDVDDGWKVAMATLGFERGTAFLSQQLRFQEELSELIDLAAQERRGRRAARAATAWRSPTSACRS